MVDDSVEQCPYCAAQRPVVSHREQIASTNETSAAMPKREPLTSQEVFDRFDSLYPSLRDSGETTSAYEIARREAFVWFSEGVRWMESRQ
jgi:hypothetical protein